jgi:hypothetical protein
MATPKFKEYFDKSFADNREQFQLFMLTCQDYLQDRQKYSEEFNRQGQPIKVILLEVEARLCGRMERGKNAVYSANLSEKYWDEVRKYFPCIDEVGVKITKVV